MQTISTRVQRMKLQSWITAIICVFLWLQSYVSAQQGFGQQELANEYSSRIEPPREIERLLREAEREIAKKNWSVAIKALGLVLGIDPESNQIEGKGQDFFLTTDDGIRTKTIHQSARDLFNSIPDEGRKTIELLYGIEVQRQLEEAAAKDDWSTIDLLAGKYPMTAYGRQAAYLSAERQVLLGNPAWAAMRWENLLTWQTAREEFGPDLGIASATAWKVAGNPESAKRLLKSTSKLFNVQKVTYQDVELDLSNIDASLEKLNDTLLSMRSVKQASPRFQGGDSERNADTYAGLPLPFVEWHSQLHESGRHEDRAIETMNQVARSNDQASLAPSRSAVIIPPYLVCMTYDQRIHAIHLQTGVVEAVCPFSGSPQYNNSQFSDGESRLPLQEELVQRIWGQQATGQLSADSQNVYAVVEQPAYDTAENLHRGVNAMIAMHVPRRPFNVLQAYNISKQISLSWEVGGESGLAEPELANVLFLGAPLPFNNELYIIGESNGELLLFALSPENGRLRWKQQLAANNVFTIAQDAIRRNFGCSPSFHAGVLLCPTLSNELVAIDLNRRSLLWSKSYERSREAALNSRSNNWGITQQSSFRPLEFRSSEIAVVADQGVIVYAPPDGSGLFVLDAFTGKQLWETTERRVQYVGCIVDGTIVVSTLGSSIVGLNIKDGSQRWNTPLKEKYGLVAGRLVRNADQIFVPTSDRQIVQINAKTGDIVASTKVEMMVGNLVAANDSLISVSPIAVSSYPIRDAVKAKLQMEELAGDTNAPLAIAKKSEIALAENNLDQAFNYAFDAYKKAPQDPNIRLLMRKIAISAIEQDFERYLPRVTELNDLMVSGPQRDVYFLFLIRGLIIREQYDEALDRLTSLISVKSQSSYAADLGQAKQLDLGDYRIVLEEQWIATTLDRLLKLASEKARQASETKLMENLSTRSSEFSNSSLIERYTRHVTLTAPLRVRRAFQEYAAGELLKAEWNAKHAMQLAEQSNEIDQKEEIIRVAATIRMLVYRDVRRANAAVEMAKIANIPSGEIMSFSLATLLKSPLLEGCSAPKSSTSTQMNTDQLEAWMTNRSIDVNELLDSAAEVQKRLPNWPRSEVTVTPAESTSFEAPATGFPTRIVSSSGESLSGWHIQMLPAGIQINDSTFQQKVGIPVESNVMSNMQQFSNCFIVDSIVFIQRGGELIAVDSLAATKPIDSFNLNQFDAEESRALLWQEMIGTDTNSFQGMRNFSRNTRDRWDFGAEKPKDTGAVSAVVAGEYGIVTASARTIQCLDFLSGETLWSVSTKVFESASVSGKDSISSNPWLSYRDGIVYVFDPVGKRRLMLDARDGEKLDATKLKFTGEVWNVFEDTFLTYSKSNDNKYNFTLRSLESTDELLTAEIPNSERVEASNGRVVFWGDEGLRFWNVKERKTHFYPLPATAKIRYINLHDFQDTIVLMGHSSAMSTEVLDRESEDSFTSATGSILAIRNDTGEPIWKHPVASHFLFPLYQPRIGPAFVLARPLAYRMGNVTVRSGSVAVVDLQTGGLLYQNDYLPTRRGARFEARIFPKQNKVFMSYRTAGLDIVWNGNPMPNPIEPLIDLGKTSADELISKMPAEFKQQMTNESNSTDFGED